jgi:hypothetical protein
VNTSKSNIEIMNHEIQNKINNAVWLRPGYREFWKKKVISYEKVTPHEVLIVNLEAGVDADVGRF